MKCQWCSNEDTQQDKTFYEKELDEFVIYFTCSKCPRITIVRFPSEIGQTN